MSEKQSDQSLARSIGLFRLVFYGVGTILGAGIFVVIGEVIGEAGRLAPLAYVAAGLIAFTTALSYAEISARIPTAGGPIDYVEKATGSFLAGSATGWMFMIANVVSAATITTGFVSYLSIFYAPPEWIPAVGLVLALGALASTGMKHSTTFMVITTVIGVGALLAVLWATRDGLVAAPGAVMDALGSPAEGAWMGLFAGAFLAIYSFIGFGDMALTAEEVKNVERTMPRGIVLALGIVFVFYLLVSAALIGSAEIDRVAGAEAPLVEAVKAAGWVGWPIGVASLFVIVNGALTQIIGAARLLFDIGRDGRGAPKALGRVNPKTRTPLSATILISLVVMALAVAVPLKTLAAGTSLVILIVFVGVNVSLILLKRDGQPEQVPNVWTVVPWLGVATCLGAIGFQLFQWTMAGG